MYERRCENYVDCLYSYLNNYLDAIARINLLVRVQCLREDCRTLHFR